MKLRKLEIHKLHGALTQTVEFDGNLNLVVGINGAGKTSLINAIDWLLRVDLPSLCTTEFESLKLEFSHENRDVTLLATQTPASVVISAEGLSGESPITTRLQWPPAKIGDERPLDDVRQLYTSMRPEAHEVPLWNYLAKLPKPVVLSLDRTLSAEIGNTTVYVDRDARLTTRRAPERVSTPISKVKQVTGERFFRYRSWVAQLNERLKAQLMMTIFQDPPQSGRKSAAVGALSEAEVVKLENKVHDLVFSLTRNESQTQQVTKYFSNVRRSLKQVSNLDESQNRVLSGIFSSQFRQISAMAEAFDTYDRSAAEAYETLGRYLQVVNGFLSDSNKQLSFSETKGRLQFDFVSSDGKAIGQSKDVSNLSSGERQILVLLTFLAFMASSDNVFLVDEPELSLHMAWQTKLVDSFIKLRPPQSQLILATHSPEIVATHRKAVIRLSPNYSL